MYFPNYGLAKRRLDKSLKSVVSQYPLTKNKVKAPKHIPNHRGGTFIIVVDMG